MNRRTAGDGSIENPPPANKRLERTRYERASLLSCVGEPLKRIVGRFLLKPPLSMTNFKIRLLTLLSAVLLVPICFADHLPPKDQARGRPEKKLAGIFLDHTKVSEVIRMYGEPSEVQKEPKPPNLNVVDTYHYRWFKPRMKLHLVVFRFNETKNGEYIALIEVEGSQPTGRIHGTGRGLKLGDDLADVRRIYGPRYKVRNKPKLNIHDVMIQWRVEEFSLVAELNKKGKITKLSLFAPE